MKSRIRNTMLGLTLGAGLVCCFWIGEQDAQAHFKNGQWYVRHQPVSLRLVGQTCCHPTNTFYRLKWGTHKHQALVWFPCASTHAFITYAHRTRRGGRAWIGACGVLKERRLRL